MDHVNALFSPKSEDLLVSLFGLKDFATSSANIESPARLEYYVNFADFLITRELHQNQIKHCF